LRRVGVSRTPALVERITSLTFGVLPAADADGALIDIWGLSIRQAAVAALLASGAGRREAARSLGVSEAVVKKRADEVYQILQVGSAAALARKVVEARTVRWLTHLSRGDLGFMDVGTEPLQLILRPGGGRIAVSDYGPFSGRPVLVSHTLMSTRPVNRSLVRALQGVGWRPIAIDRPGYGLSDEVDGAEPGQHDPYATAAEDVTLVMNALQIARFDLVVRVSAGLALAVQARMPERLGRVVLVNPGLPLSHDRRRQGPFGVAKEAYLRNPALPQVLLRALSHALTPNRFVSAMRALVRGSPPDEQAVEDPALMRDYFRAQRLFATGRLAGVLNEQLAYAHGSKPQPVSGVRDWEILVGAHDTLHDPTDMLTYWRSVLPDAGWRLAEDAGRLMAFTHPQLIVAALVGKSGASRVA
jgi:pimeloyl-ACP methyl ester carboxylesterase/DNA-binding CsgD family transcriptional regulator